VDASDPGAGRSRLILRGCMFQSSIVCRNAPCALRSALTKRKAATVAPSVLRETLAHASLVSSRRSPGSRRSDCGYGCFEFLGEFAGRSPSRRRCFAVLILWSEQSRSDGGWPFEREGLSFCCLAHVSMADLRSIASRTVRVGSCPASSTMSSSASLSLDAHRTNGCKHSSRFHRLMRHGAP
jgi:hypothetical protein